MKHILTWVIVLSAVPGFAAVNPLKAIPKLPAFSEKGTIEFPKEAWWTEAELKSLNAQMKAEKTRKIASAPSESQMSPKYREFVDHLLKIKNPEELDALLEKSNSEYDSYPTDLKFVAAQLIPLQAYRGYIYRLRPLVMQARVADSILVTSARTAVGALTVLMPQEQNQVLIDYITRPFGNDIGAFHTEEQLQNFLRARVYPSVATAAGRIKALNLKSQAVLWDNRMVFGKESFPDNVDDRFRIIGEAERMSVLSMMHANLYSIVMATSFDLSGMMRIQKGLSELIGFDAAFGDIDGLSAKKRTELVRREGQYLKRTCENPKSGESLRCLALAFEHLRASVNAADMVYRITKATPEDTWRVLDPGALKPFDRMNRLAFDIQKKLVNEGSADIRSNVDGRVARVNLRQFFIDNPPKSLQIFLPTEFDRSAEYMQKNVDKTDVTFRNFRAGRATAWSADAFSPYVSGATPEQGARLLNQAWGGWFVGAPMLMVF